jgi:hypothetical protein
MGLFAGAILPKKPFPHAPVRIGRSKPVDVLASNVSEGGTASKAGELAGRNMTRL